MLGSVTVEYNDLLEGETQVEEFEDVDAVEIAGNPEGAGEALIIQHRDDRVNTVRNGVSIREIA
jgi:hypothetical protein